MIRANAHKYSVSAMCRILQVNRSTYYYEAATKKDESELTADIQEIFRKSRNHYGTRKIKKELADCGKQVSGRRIGRIMKENIEKEPLAKIDYVKAVNGLTMQQQKEIKAPMLIAMAVYKGKTRLIDNTILH